MHHSRCQTTMSPGTKLLGPLAIDRWRSPREILAKGMSRGPWERGRPVAKPPLLTSASLLPWRGSRLTSGAFSPTGLLNKAWRFSPTAGRAEMPPPDKPPQQLPALPGQCTIQQPRREASYLATCASAFGSANPKPLFAFSPLCSPVPPCHPEPEFKVPDCWSHGFHAR